MSKTLYGLQRIKNTIVHSHSPKIAEYSQEVNNRITQEVKNVLLIAKNTNESNEVLIIGNTLFSQKAVVLGTEYGVKIEPIKKPVMRI